MLSKFIKIALVFFMCCLTSFTWAESDSNELVGLKVLPLPDNKLRVEFQFRKNLLVSPKSFFIKKPATLIFDFLDVRDGLPASDTSKKINLGALDKYNLVSAANRVRAVLSLQQAITYSTERVGNKFYVNISSQVKQRLYQPKRRYLTDKLEQGSNKILDVDFRGVGHNSGKLIIALSKEDINVDVSQSDNKITLKILNSGISPKYLRTLDVSDFHTPAKSIEIFQYAKSSKFVINTKGNFGQFTYQVNNKFFVEVFPLSKEEIAKQKLKKKVYTGKRISLNFQNIEIRAVLQLLAEFTGKNMVVSDSVGGSITLHLNDVPWDQALGIILKTKGLAERKIGEVVLIAPTSEIADREQQEMKAQEQSKELAPLLSNLMHINYAKAADVAEILKNESTHLLSPRGSVTVDTRTNALWLQDTGAQLDEIKNLIKKLDIPVKQVLIEARVVTVNKDFEDDIGIRFGVSNATHMSGTLEGANKIAGGTIPSAVPLAERLNFDALAPVTTGNPASIGLALAKLGDGTLLDLELSALETEGRGEVISSPRLITGNQQAATIESGEEIPYQEATSSGATSVSFKKAVLSLKVTPQITPDNKIILELMVNQDTASAQRFNGVPAILTKQIETNVLVNNGQTLVLGGIYKLDKTSAVVRVPFLGHIPVVGMLFRNKRNIVKHEELLIFITPKIIRHSFTTNT